MKHSTPIDLAAYEQRIASLEAELAAEREDVRAMPAAMFDMLTRLERNERACDLFRGALIVRARQVAGELLGRNE